MQSVHEPSASQSIRHIAARGDRARRVSVAHRRAARFALPAAATAVLASAVTTVLGGPRTVGLALLAAGAVAAVLTALEARRSRLVPDDVAAAMDRAADLGGSLRSALWFADPGGDQTPRDDRNADWVAFHLEAAASRAAEIDWPRVYERPPARLQWGMALLCALITIGLFVRPLPRLSTRSVHSLEAAAPTPVPNAPAAAASVVPQLVEGMRALRSGRKPSTEQLSAIGRALEVARNDPAAQKRIEDLMIRSESDPNHQLSATDSDSGDGALPDDLHNGFELGDLDWAYQEALARGGADERARLDAGADAAASESTRDGKAGEGAVDPAASGSTAGVPIEADLRGQAASFSSLLLGRQQASGGPDSPAAPKSPERSATLAAALRHEVIHAQSDVDVPNLDAPTARRATNAGRTPAAAIATDQVGRYERSHAIQPPAVPDARRPLVHSVFVRPAETGAPVKQP